MPLERRPLGRTGETVPSLCLGTMMFGDQIGEAEAQRQMDRCLERGIDMLDTAELYTIPPKAETQGESERIVGRWVEDRGVRDRVFLATKVTGRSDNGWLRDGAPVRVTREQVRLAAERSLRNLRTEMIDLYQIHWPDRPTRGFGGDLHGWRPYEDDGVPIEEQLSVLGDLVAEGKVRHVGLSNETPWGVMAFLRAAERSGLPRVVTNQNAYNLTNRYYEYGLAEIAQQEAVGLMAYSPIGQGALTGKYLGGAKPSGSRGEMFGRLGRYESPSADEAIRAYVEVARELGVTPAVLAMQFVTTRPFVTTNVFGAHGEDQLDEVFASLDMAWTEDAEEAVNAVHARLPNVCP
jgi:aryl-alcohol dehydrogenase-like predicted oxidoreductase